MNDMVADLSSCSMVLNIFLQIIKSNAPTKSSKYRPSFEDIGHVLSEKLSQELRTASETLGQKLLFDEQASIHSPWGSHSSVDLFPQIFIPSGYYERLHTIKPTGNDRTKLEELFEIFMSRIRENYGDNLHPYSPNLFETRLDRLKELAKANNAISDFVHHQYSRHFGASKVVHNVS